MSLLNKKNSTCVVCKGRGTILVLGDAPHWETCNECLGTALVLAPEQWHRFHILTGRPPRQESES